MQETGRTSIKIPRSDSSWWKKLKEWYFGYKWYLIAAVWVIALVMGYIGAKNYLSTLDPKCTTWDSLYLALQLFVLNPSVQISGVIGWELQVARFLAPAVAAYTTLETLSFIFREQIQTFRLRFCSDHIVICGLGRKGLLISESYLKCGNKVVVIEKDETNTLISQCREQGATVLIGDATDPALLRRAQVHKAKYLITVCGQDGVNTDIAVHSKELVSQRKNSELTCFVHIVDPQLCRLLRGQEIQMGRPDLFRLEFFNVFESAARILLNEYPPFDRSDKTQGTKPHLVVVGIGHMGESLVVNAARRWRDANDANDKRLHVTLIDKDATGKKASLYLRYPQMERVCELVPVQLDVQSAEFEQGEFLLNANKECDVTIIYVCLDDDSNSMAAGLTLSNRLTNFKITGNEIPIVVRMVHEAGLATLLRVQGNQPGGFANLHAFGVLDQTCTPELILGCTFEILARAFHEEYIRNEINKGNTPQKNPSMVPWEKLSESLRESNLKAAEHIPVKLAAVDCTMTITTDWQVPVFQFSEQEIEKMAVMEHERWVKERLKAKWKPGPRDPVKKTSPYLVDWSKLTEDVKEIDRILVRNIPLVVAKAGFQIYRLKSGADK